MTVRPSDTARDMLLRAIQIEVRNGALYDSLAEIFRGYEPTITETFREMAGEERQHGTELKAYFRAEFGPVPLLTGEPKEVIEAPDLEDPEALIFDSMAIEQALEIGLHAEEAAREFYRLELSHASDPELQRIFRELGEFEERHVQILQEKLAERKRVASPTSR